MKILKFKLKTRYILLIVFLFLSLVLFKSCVYNKEIFVINDKLKITVFKTLDGIFIIPYKYENHSKPKTNYLQINSLLDLSLYIDTSKNEIYYHSDYNIVSIDNTQNHFSRFIDADSTFESIPGDKNSLSSVNFARVTNKDYLLEYNLGVNNLLNIYMERNNYVKLW